VASNLFRKEAVQHAVRGRLDGSVILAVPLSVTVLGLLAIAVISAVVIFSATATYARRETAPGWLTPDQGVIRAAALSSGQVETVFVSEGDSVAVGDSIAQLRLDSQTTEGAVGDRILDALRDQAEAAEQTALAEIAAIDLETQRQRASLTNLQRERVEILQQIDSQRQQVSLAEDQVERAEQLSERGFLSARELDDRRLRALSAQQNLDALERNLVVIDRQISDSEAAISRAPVDTEAARGRARSARASLQERLSGQAARTSTLITAPAEARVAALPVRIGQTVRAGETVAVLVPEGGELVVELYVPTRAVGFIQPGQEVRLKIDAFPHQRFGTSRARVASVSRTVLAPDEAAIPGLQLREPVFRVEAVLEQSDIVAYGEVIPLQPGLLVSADIIIDRRNLIEWLFDPLFAAGRR